MTLHELLLLSPEATRYESLLRKHRLPNLHIRLAETAEAGQRHVANATIIFGHPAWVARLLESAGRLQWVQSTFAGVDALCRPGLRTDYRLTGVKGVFGQLISEYVFAYVLAIERRLFEARDHQKKQLWCDTDYRSLSGLTIGVCGLGSIGSHVAATAAHFGMKVLGFRQTPKTVEGVETVFCPPHLSGFLKPLDYLVLTLPHTRDTHHLISRDALSAMKPSSVVINVGRGGLVHEPDLIAALQEKKIRAAVLDVFETEPLPAASPLWEMENVLITAHNAAKSFPEAVVTIFCENYLRFCANEPLQFQIDFNRGY
jgi:phosphoglycerate dehydrogenase-like enzyme